MLKRMLTERLAPGGSDWFERALLVARTGDIADAFSVAPRACGTRPLTPSTEELLELGMLGLRWVVHRTSVDEIARILLLCEAAAAAPDESLVTECYRSGDNGEKRAVLRSLALLPHAPRYLALAISSCRTSVHTVFEAICCENPYPAAQFPDPAFNQMVLKALFTGVPLERIIHLDERKNAELTRMALGYASERRAAGRSVPGDIASLSAGEGISSSEGGTTQ